MFDLKQKRIDKGMTQEQLAKMVGVVRTNISNIECGYTRPSVDTAKLIANVLGFDWTEFFE